MSRRERSFFGPRARATALVAASLLFTAGLAPRAAAGRQAATEPRREQLLNGLKVYLLPRPGDAQALLKLRIRSGAAFDLAGKEGVMALLGDALFSDPSVHEYVKEDLGGRLEVSTGYDHIDVTLAGRASEFERMVELLRNAVVSTQLSPEVFARLRDARAKVTRDIDLAPGTMADRAAASRLYGPHPYGRVAEGTPESLARVERADLLLVRERFLNPNNATLVVAGPVEPARAMRALRQYLGAWRRSDREVPATFRLPEPPDARTLIVNRAGAPDAEVRLFVRGLARSDRDAPAARLLAALVQARWLKSFPELKNRPFFVEHQPRAVAGLFRLGASVPAKSAAQALQTARAALLSFDTAPPTPQELEAARREVIAALGAGTDSAAAQADLWLDLETYQTNSSEEARALADVPAGELRRVAARLFLGAPAAAVVVGDATQLRAELARAGEVEVLGDGSSATTAPRPATEAKPFSLPVKRP